MPAALLHDAGVLSSLGFASLHDHYRTRLSNPGLLTSSNPKYHFFAFDSLINLGLRGHDSRLILRRGFTEGSESTQGVKFRGNKDNLFDTEHVDARPMVNKLAAAINIQKPTYFYTHTCSMKTHFGMKDLWEWMESDDVFVLLYRLDASLRL